ncbi:MAG: ribosome small subunit-dependent GTPase A [Sandaracinaceae bacterium]|nr:ribosome small subunit-dependent GTPase A [Sandaracinaceae bacterium]
MEGVVLRAASGHFEVWLPHGERLHCTMWGRLKKEKWRSELVVAGDRVIVDRVGPGEGVIVEVFERRSWLVRREPGPRGRHFEDLIVANVDVLFVCVAATAPPIQPHLVDRLLVAGFLGRMACAVVFTKVDTLVDEMSRASAEEWAMIYRQAGHEVFWTSAQTGEGISALREALNHRVSAFVGASGVGKSSLLNAILPELGLRVGELDSKGRSGTHTTRAVSLHRVGEGWVADTPGLRDLALGQVNLQVLHMAFPEFARLPPCRFRDCRHLNEPGCEVKAALERGEIAKSRLASFHRILKGDE